MFEAEIIEIQEGVLKELGLKYSWGKFTGAPDTFNAGEDIAK